MSSDIKQRLRAPWGGSPDNCKEAADAIEALEGERDKLKWSMEWYEDRAEAAEARAERLRAALEAIAVRAGTFEGRGSYIAYVELAGEIEKMADSARNGEEP